MPVEPITISPTCVPEVLKFAKCAVAFAPEYPICANAFVPEPLSPASLIADAVSVPFLNISMPLIPELTEFTAEKEGALVPTPILPVFCSIRAASPTFATQKVRLPTDSTDAFVFKAPT